MAEPHRLAADHAEAFGPAAEEERNGQGHAIRIPQRAILDVTLESTGLVILSDVDYPGWQLTIDDEPAPIYRVNV